MSLSGCAPKAAEQKNTGFLSDYETLISQSPSQDLLLHLYTDEDLSGYNRLLIKNVSVIPSIPLSEQTQEQKELYIRMSDYVKDGLNRAIMEDPMFILANEESSSTLELEVAISAVEVHFSDLKWNQFSPTALGLNVVSYGVYLDDAVRILVESRISKGKILMAQSMQIIQDTPIRIESDKLSFNDLKPALDLWLKESTKNIMRIRSGKAKAKEAK